MNYGDIIVEGYKIGMRTLLLIVLLTLCTFAVLAVASNQAMAISLKENPVIQDSSIKLGDIFHGLPTGENKILGPAPRPGHDMVLNARTLLRIAIALDLPWRPSSSSDYIVLSRAGTVISQDLIENALREQLSAKGVTGKYNILIGNGTADMVLPADQPAQVEISKINIKPDQNWFEATLVAPSKENPIKRTRISGTIERLTDIPVLRETLRGDIIIRKNDIEMVEIRERDLKPDMVISREDLIGLTPRRMITSGQPIKITEVESPKIVKRGDTITMVFINGGLHLTALGKALEHGTKGDIIRVVNTGSSKTIEGEVTASKEVTIRSF